MSNEETEKKKVDIWVTKSQVLELEVFTRWQEEVKKKEKTYKRALKEAMELWIEKYSQR
jgi:hypothetical protein